MKKRTNDHDSKGRRRVLARALADELHDVQGSATWTRLDGSAPDVESPQTSVLSEAATSESIPDTA